MNIINNLCKIIQLDEYDIIIPFICYKCGKCCRNFTPSIFVDTITIANHLNKSPEEIKRNHERNYINESDCTFLSDYNQQCMIYSLRPECCRMYPLDTMNGKAEVNCLGYDEFYRIYEPFFDRDGYAKRESLEKYKKEGGDIRPISDKKWQIIWQKFKKIEPPPSNLMVECFEQMNTGERNMKNRNH